MKRYRVIVLQHQQTTNVQRCSHRYRCLSLETSEDWNICGLGLGLGTAGMEYKTDNVHLQFANVSLL